MICASVLVGMNLVISGQSLPCLLKWCRKSSFSFCVHFCTVFTPTSLIMGTCCGGDRCRAAAPADAEER